MGAWDEIVKDSRTRLGERDDCLSDEQVAEVMSWPNAILAANKVVEAAKAINEGIRGDYMNAVDPTVLKTWIRHDRISALRTALKKLEEG